MKNKKVISVILETMQKMVVVLTSTADRLDKVEKALELDFICGRWVMPHDNLSLTIRKSSFGYRIVLLCRGQVVRCYDAAADSKGNVTYWVPGGEAIGKVWYEYGNPYIILENLGAFYLHEADSDTAANC